MSSQINNHISDEEIQNSLDSNFKASDAGVINHLKQCMMCRKRLEEYWQLYELLSYEIPLSSLPAPTIEKIVSITSAEAEAFSQIPGESYTEKALSCSTGGIQTIDVLKQNTAKQSAEGVFSSDIVLKAVWKKAGILALSFLAGLGILFLPITLSEILTSVLQFVMNFSARGYSYVQLCIDFIKTNLDIRPAFLVLKQIVLNIPLSLVQYLISVTITVIIISVIDRFIYQKLLRRR